MHVGVISFPDLDKGQNMKYALEQITDSKVTLLSITQKLPKNIDVIFITGGYRLLKDTKEKIPFLVEELYEAEEKGKIIIGTGEGFAFLSTIKLLPGYFEVRTNDQCFSNFVYLKIHRSQTIMTHRIDKNIILRIPVHYYQLSYRALENELIEMRQNRQILFHYCDAQGRISKMSNPTGSVDNIAGVCNNTGRVFGIFPRPELSFLIENEISDGRFILQSVLSWQ